MELKFIKGFKSLLSARTLALCAVYATIIAVSFYFAYMLRFDFKFEDIAQHTEMQHILLPIFMAVEFVALLLFRQFRIVAGYFYMRDMFLLVWSQVFAFSLLYLIGVFIEPFYIPRGVLLICFMVMVGILSAFRIGMRLLREKMLAPVSAADRTVKSRIAIIGAGNLGSSLASDLMAKKHLGINPVVFFDDDNLKIGRQIMGLEVERIPEDFSQMKKKYMIDKAIIASAKFPASRLSDITTALSKIGVNVLMQPSYFDFAMGRTKLAPVREVNVLDVLGRPSVDLDDETIGDSLCGKVVMVTGAGGSIGSELCRQIAMRKVHTLLLVEHCEVQLFKIEQDLISRKYGIIIKPFVASVCDGPRMERIIGRFKPQIIFHAAAHKHVPMMESQPGEALKNNVLGTWTVADAASRLGVEKFVMISTDKAVNPTNVMGASKRFAELVVQSMQARAGNNTQFVAVRFGNVLGSSGSVIPTFKRQIEEGGPLTLTHPDVTRYFMTIPEAVGLVLQCSAFANGGEIFVLDMGEPIKIIDLARRMITLSGFEPDKDIKIEIIGLRHGEKLYEELQNKDERLVRTPHNRIFCFNCESEKYEDVYKYVSQIKSIADTSSINDLKKFIGQVVPEYQIQYYD